MMTNSLRARSALLVSTALLLAACGSTTTGSRPRRLPSLSSATPSATFTRTPEATTAAPLPDSERWLPAKHLAPASGWSSNPSGLVYENGTYHAFYRHNPAGEDAAGADRLGACDQHRPGELDRSAGRDSGCSRRRALLSGAVVADTSNTSGLGTDTEPPLVAIYA